MKARLIELEKDYPDLESWWKGHGWSAVPRPILPKLGVIIEKDDGEKLAATFVYMDNSAPVCWLEWTVTNPHNRPTVSLIALQRVIEAAKSAVEGISTQENGYSVMLTTCRQHSLTRFYERMGFTKTDEGVTHLLAPLSIPQEAGK